METENVLGVVLYKGNLPKGVMTFKEFKNLSVRHLGGRWWDSTKTISLPQKEWSYVTIFNVDKYVKKYQI
jgi:hypothetical protein